MTRIITKLARRLAFKPKQSEKPVFSVVLGTYNRKDLLPLAIESVRANAGFAKYEIIVIDGGSTDGSVEWLTQQKDILLIVQHNRGNFLGKQIERRSWGYFMNLGFKAAQGKYILMISDDCLLLPNAIELGIAALEKQNTMLKKIGGAAFYFRNWPDEQEYYVQRTLGGKLMVNHGLFVRDALEKIGWIDEDSYMFYKADGDLCLRLWNEGFKIIDVPGAFVEHYYDSEEAVRLQNNETLQQDKKTYAARWKSLTLMSKEKQTMGKLYLSHNDQEHTAKSKFGSLGTSI
jgi:glycosyltransferase involved in cell wall biosynthesis